MHHRIQSAGKRLLSLLGCHRTVSFRKLVCSVILDHREEAIEDRYRDALAHAWTAVVQLEDIGVVARGGMSERLYSGVPDFALQLTARGEAFLANAETFRYRRPDSRFLAREAADWLLLFLDAGGERATLTLSDVMNPAYHMGEVEVSDSLGNRYRHGTRTFTWVFIECLRRYARSGVLAVQYDSHDAAVRWSRRFAADLYALGPPTADEVADVCALKFRLAPGLDVRSVDRIGWISRS